MNRKVLWLVSMTGLLAWLSLNQSAHPQTAPGAIAGGAEASNSRGVDVIGTPSDKGAKSAKIRGELLSLDTESARFATEAGEIQLSLGELRRVSFYDHPAASSPVDQWLTLRDGTQIPITSVVLDAGAKGVLKVDRTCEIVLPTEHIADVRFKSLTPAQSTQWEAYRQSRLSADMLVLVRSEEVLDKIEGIVASISPETVNFEFSGQTVPAPITKLAGLRFFSNRDAPLSRLAAVVKDVYGGSWQANELGLAPADKEVRIKLRCGAEVGLPLSMIQEIDFSVGSQKYLSELPAVDRTTQGRLALAKSIPGSDNIFGADSPVGGSVSSSNIEFFGGGSVTYRVPEGFTQLSGSVELSPQGGKTTPCVVQVLIERKVAWEKELASIRQPESLEIPVKQDQRVQLIVKSSSPLPVGDIVVFRDLRFLK